MFLHTREMKAHILNVHENENSFSGFTLIKLIRYYNLPSVYYLSVIYVL